MTTKEIRLCGKKATIAYCYATEISFNKYTGVTVENFDTENPEHPIYLILSALLSYSEGTDSEPVLTDRDLIYKAKPGELIEAVQTVFQLRNEWYAIPKGDKVPEEGEGEKKN